MLQHLSGGGDGIDLLSDCAAVNRESSPAPNRKSRGGLGPAGLTARMLLSVALSPQPRKFMPDENDLIYSALQQSYTADGKTVEVCIYRMPDTGWTLEVVDPYGNSTVWDGEFNTDQEAFDLFLEEIKAEGIDAMIGPEPTVLG